MAVRSNPAFKEVYPKAREFVQNSVDYTELVDEFGIRKPHISMEVRQKQVYEVAFLAGEEEVFSIVATSADTVELRQRFVFPLHPSTIKCGVVDESKTDSKTAGGFGIGYKDASCQIIFEGGAVSYEMKSATHAIEWHFLAVEERSKSPGIQSSKGLYVRVCAARRACAPEQANTLCVKIRLPEIAKRFMQVVMPRCGVFWSPHLLPNAPLLRAQESPFVAIGSTRGAFRLDEAYNWIHVRTYSGEELPFPPPGVYCRGLFVMQMTGWQKMHAGVVLCGSGSVNASGRDRNLVDPLKLLHAAAALFISLASKAANPFQPLALAAMRKQYGQTTAEDSRLLQIFAKEPEDEAPGSFLAKVMEVIGSGNIGKLLWGDKLIYCFKPLKCDADRWAFGRINSSSSAVAIELPDDADYNTRICHPLDSALDIVLERSGIECGSSTVELASIARHVMRCGMGGDPDAADVAYAREIFAVDCLNEEHDPGLVAWSAPRQNVFVVARHVDAPCTCDRFRLLCMRLASCSESPAFSQRVARLLASSASLGEVVSVAEVRTLVDKQLFGADYSEEDGVIDLASDSGETDEGGGGGGGEAGEGGEGGEGGQNDVVDKLFEVLRAAKNKRALEQAIRVVRPRHP